MKRPTPTYPIDEVVARRLDVLERLIDDEYGGSPSVFEEKTGIKMAQVNQWFTGYRALRDKALKRIKEKTGKSDGWFDVPIEAKPIATPQNSPVSLDIRPGAPGDLGATIETLRSYLRSAGKKDAVGALLLELAKDPDDDQTALSLQTMLDKAFVQAPQKRAQL